MQGPWVGQHFYYRSHHSQGKNFQNCRHASGFLYYVSREGVTGEREDLAGDLSERVAVIREKTDLPLVVGFGISSAPQVRGVAEVADGVVVGSALVNCISANLGDSEAALSSLQARLEELMSGLLAESS